jgi:outer membrane protein assembly factor BamD
MATSSPRLAQILAAALLAGGLAACSGKTEDVQFTEQPVEQLYNKAADLLDNRRWSEAALAFEEVERQHPYSSWARRSMLMNAYAKYQSNQYDQAIDAARRYIQLYPGNETAAYAYYLAALCNFEQILDVGRDQKTTQDALDALLEVTRRYPNSDYARDAKLKIDMTYDQLAGKEMEVGRFYLKRNQHLAAINRFKRVIDDPNYQTTTHAPEALHRLVESYLSVGMLDEAKRTAAVLGYNYPGNKWYERTFEIMERSGLSPVAAEAAPRATQTSAP